MSEAASSRRRAREVALQVLFAIDLATLRERHEPDRAPIQPPARQPMTPLPEPSAPPTAEEAFEAIAGHFEMPGGAREFARALSLAVCEKLTEIDALIGAHSRNWRVDRMAAVDRSILRLATFELCHTDTPAAVVLNEAVDLARRFGSDPSPAFVNGILDAIAHRVRDLPDEGA